MEDAPVTIDGLRYAHDLDGDPLTVTAASSAGHSVTIGSDKRTLRVTPAKDFNGQLIVTYGISDGRRYTTAHARVNVRPVDDPPSAADSSYEVRGLTMISLPATDVDGDSLTYTITQYPQHGTLGGPLPQSSYVPNDGFSGEDQLSYSVTDGRATAFATVRLHVKLGAQPIALSSFASGDEDQPLNIFLGSANAQGKPLTYTITSQPGHGVLSGTPPDLVYTPKPNFFGDDSLQFIVDNGVPSSTATITIAVASVPDLPVADPQMLTVNEDSHLGITLTGRDADGDFFDFEVTSNPAHGSLSSFGTFRMYTPDPNFHGTDSFTYVARSFFDQSLPATVTIEVLSVEDPPVAVALTKSVAEDSSVAITLAGIDGDGDPITGFIVQPPAHGSFTGTPPDLTYRPNANFNGFDSFTYTVASGGVTSEPATVNINVTAVNDPPVATDDTITTAEDTQVSFTLRGTDVDNQGLTFTTLAPLPEGSWSGSGASLTYKPAPNINGSRTLRFRVSDGFTSSDASVAITITPVDDPPTAIDDFLSTAPGTPLTISITSNDIEPDGEPLTIQPIGATAHGTAEIVDGQLVYTPGAGFHDTDVFAYTVVDPQGTPSTAHVHIGVGEFPRDAPAERLLAVGGPTSTSEARRVPALSGDGRYLAFTSPVPLLAGDSNGFQDIYVLDRNTRALTRASAAAGGGDSNGASLRPHLSSDGRYVVFESLATNLVAGDTNGRWDVFRHDRVTGATVRVSVATDDAQGTGDSIDAEISDDGNRIAFSSTAFELVGDDTNGTSDIFVRDVAAGTTTRVSMGTIGEGDNDSTEPALSGNGRYVAFTSRATNLVAGDDNNASDVFVRDLLASTTTRISVTSNNKEANKRSFGPSISQDGLFISFVSDATNLVTDVTGASQVYVRSVTPQTTTWSGVSSTSIWARLSGSGRYLVLFNSFSGVTLRDRLAAATLTPPGAGFWLWPMLSDNGRYVVAIDTSQVTTGHLLVAPNPLAD